jgi:hypothetical protein
VFEEVLTDYVSYDAEERERSVCLSFYSFITGKDGPGSIMFIPDPDLDLSKLKSLGSGHQHYSHSIGWR